MFMMVKKEYRPNRPVCIENLLGEQLFKVEGLDASQFIGDSVDHGKMRSWSAGMAFYSVLGKNVHVIHSNTVFYELMQIFD